MNDLEYMKKRPGGLLLAVFFLVASAASFFVFSWMEGGTCRAVCLLVVDAPGSGGSCHEELRRRLAFFFEALARGRIGPLSPPADEALVAGTAAAARDGCLRSVKAADDEASTFVLEFRGASRGQVEGSMKECLAGIDACLASAARRLIIEEISTCEAELNGLLRRRCFPVKAFGESESLAAGTVDLYSRLDELRRMLGESGSCLKTVQTAVFDDKRASTRWVVALLGLGLAAFVLLIESRNLVERRSKAMVEVCASVDCPLLAEIPRIPEPLVAGSSPLSPGAEAFRRLRTALVASSKARRLLVLSSFPGEGVSTVVSNLAMVMAEDGGKVLMVDANLRRPSLARRFNVYDDAGLSDVLIDSEPEELLWHGGEVPVSLLSAGPRPPDASALLGGPRSAVVGEFLEGAPYDFVLIDCPPLSVSGDALELARWGDGALFVCRPGFERSEAVVCALRSLRSCGVAVTGLVMNDVVESRGYLVYGFERDWT